MELDVWVRDPRLAADEPTCFQMGSGSIPCESPEPLQPDAELPPGLLGGVEGDGAGACLLNVYLQVVLQVLADSRQVAHHRDAQFLEVICISNT